MFQYSNGDKYEGEWLNDDKNGQGVYYYANGDVYEGEWMNGKLNGRGNEGIKRVGKLTEAGGEYYDGFWVEDKKEGEGTFFQSKNRNSKLF